jgi:hypothetical protein
MARGCTWGENGNGGICGEGVLKQKRHWENVIEKVIGLRRHLGKASLGFAVIGAITQDRPYL